MKDSLRSPVITLVVVSLLYLGFVVWADRQQAMSQGLGLVLSYAPYLLLATMASYSFRFFRWWWLLRRVGYGVPLIMGAISYLAGFAYTATPGKVGELIRIRYFAKLNVPAECTFGTFVFERSCDLISVLLLSLFIVSGSGLLLIAVGFVGVVVGTVLLCALKPGMLKWLEGLAKRIRLPVLPRLLAFLQVGVDHCRSWLNWTDMSIGVLLGIAAWAIVGLSFVYLLSGFTNIVPLPDAFSIYPLSMLVGAASMIPGGVGSTEGAMVLLLGQYGVVLSTAVLLAVVIRIATLWFGILLGFCAVGYLELYWRRSNRFSQSDSCQ